jgi:hypothetical protein
MSIWFKIQNPILLGDTHEFQASQIMNSEAGRGKNCGWNMVSLMDFSRFYFNGFEWILMDL